MALLTNQTLQGKGREEKKKKNNELPGLQKTVMPSEWGFFFLRDLNPEGLSCSFN